MTLLIASFIAGILTALAPCVLPLLPVVVGGSIAGSEKKAWYQPLVVALSLMVSIIIFTLLLKATTVLLGVPSNVWSIISGIIVLLLGISLGFPKIWELVSLKLGFGSKTNALLGKSFQHHGITRDILMGAALGPVFSSCSPTYAFIVAAILPQSFAWGFVNLTVYAFGLASVLLLVSIAGQSLANRLAGISNSEGWFMRSLGLLFILVGIAVIFGLDKQLQTFILDQGWYAPISDLELRLKAN